MAARYGRTLFTRIALALMTLALTLPGWSDPAGMAAVTAPLSATFTGDDWGFSAGEGEHAPAVMAQEGDTENCFMQPAGSPFAAGVRLNRWRWATSTWTANPTSPQTAIDE